MIVARFFYSKFNKEVCKGFSVKGHANSNLNKFGHDLICCAVSAVVQMCCNGLTEVAKCSVKVCSGDGFVKTRVKSDSLEAQVLLKSLELELNLLAQQHNKILKLIKVEV